MQFGFIERTVKEVQNYVHFTVDLVWMYCDFSTGVLLLRHMILYGVVAGTYQSVTEEHKTVFRKHVH